LRLTQANRRQGCARPPTDAVSTIKIAEVFNWARVAALALIAAAWAVPGFAQSSLPSWNDTAPKKSIVAFVERVTTQGGADFVPPAERIATFDNDGSLWAEHPMYFQLMFAFDRVKALAPQHPEWKDKEPFASLLKGDIKGALAGGDPAIIQIVMATHTGMTTEEFEKIVRDWIATTRHPKTGRLYTEMAYQPMLELLVYLRTNGLQDLHRLRRRRRFHARLFRAGLWHSA
jgi:hypothetical protein